MKAKLILLLFIVCVFNSFGQVSIGRSNRGPFKDFKKGEYDLIKGKTTVFVVEGFDRKEFSDMVKDVWDYNSYIIIDREEYEKNELMYLTEKYSIMVMNAFVVSVTSQSGTTTEYLYVLYDYFYPEGEVKVKKKGLSYDKNQIASIFFGGNSEAMWKMVGNKHFGNLQEDLYNYKIGYMKNYLQYINNNLKAEGFSFAYDTDYDKQKIKALAKSTLYVPDYFKTKSVWGYEDKEREDPSELFKKYNYKYEFIEDEALNEKIMEAKEDFYYLTYVRVNGQKFLSVVNGKTGDIIYKDYTTMSYQVKTKDITELASKIKK